MLNSEYCRGNAYHGRQRQGPSRGPIQGRGRIAGAEGAHRLAPFFVYGVVPSNGRELTMQDAYDTPYDRYETPFDGDEETQAIDAYLDRMDAALAQMEATLTRIEATLARVWLMVGVTGWLMLAWVALTLITKY